MSDTDFTQEAESLATDLEDEGVEVSVETLEDGIRNCVTNYTLSVEEAVRTVARKYTPDDSSDVTVSQLGGSDNEHIAVAEIPERHKNASSESAWVNATVEILSEWTIDADSVAQKAQIADDTGKAELTVWASADAPVLSEGDTIRLENVPTDEYKGSYSLKVTSDSSVEFLDEDIDAVDNLEHVEGRIVQAREGLVDRCSDEECTRVIDSSHCPDHGNVEAEKDLRLKLTIDDGRDAEDVVLQRSEAESVLGISFEEAMDHLTETLDVEKTNEYLTEGVIGKHASVAGPEIYGSIQAEEVVMHDGLDGIDVNEMLVEAREVRPAVTAE